MIFEYFYDIKSNGKGIFKNRLMHINKCELYPWNCPLINNEKILFVKI